MLSILIAVFVVLLFILVRNWYRRGEGLPPGPPNIPLIGCIPWIMGKSLFIYASELEKKFGNPRLISFRIYNKVIILINDNDIGHELFVEQAHLTSERPPFNVDSVVNPHCLGLMGSPTPRWEYARRFSIRVLRDFGLGKSRIIDEFIINELSRLEKKFDETDGKPFDPDVMMRRAVAGIICNLLFGQSSDEEDKEFEGYLTDMNKYLATPFRAILLFPFIRRFYRFPLIHKLLPDHETIDSYDRVTAFLDAKITEHREHHTAISKPNDFIDAYLLSKDNPSVIISDPVVQSNGDVHMRRIIFELFVGGADTTAITLNWALLCLGYHQEIQERMHQEIHDKIGTAMSISYSHMSELEYTKAVINEVLRFGCIAGTSLPHTTSKDIHITGYRIPKGATMLLNITELLHCESNWKNASQFDPENFLDENGKFVASKYFVGFSIGRRACPGESLARNEIFVFLTSLIQKFNIALQLDDGATFESIVNGAAMSNGLREPGSFKITVSRR